MPMCNTSNSRELHRPYPGIRYRFRDSRVISSKLCQILGARCQVLIFSQPMANSLWTTGGVSLWQLTGNVARAIRDDDLLGRASGLAFNYLLAFPAVPAGPVRTVRLTQFATRSAFPVLLRPRAAALRLSTTQAGCR